MTTHTAPKRRTLSLILAAALTLGVGATLAVAPAVIPAAPVASAEAAGLPYAPGWGPKLPFNIAQRDTYYWPGRYGANCSGNFFLEYKYVALSDGRFTMYQRIVNCK